LKFRRAGWACGYDKADREYVQNSVKLTSLKTSTLKTAKVYVGWQEDRSHGVRLSEWKCVELTQKCTKWYTLVLGVMDFQVPSFKLKTWQ